MSSLIGTQLGGRYDIEEVIGKGGMAQVYRAFDVKLRRSVALKVMAPQLSVDGEFIRRFEREARLSASLSHPAIVTVYDVGEEAGQHYIAMEFIDGRSLNAILRERGAPGLSYVVPLLDPLCQALDYAHSKGAVHRDVKPHNILVSSDGQVLLTDFGIAQPLDAGTERLTRTGTFMGTPEYISPEQLEARRVDGKSDLYALGIVAYEVLTGRVPFSGNTPQLIVAHTQNPPPPPCSIMPSLPPEIDGMIAQALSKNPADRFPTGEAFLDALQVILRRHGVAMATREEIRALVAGENSAGRPTIAVSDDATPMAVRVPPDPEQYTEVRPAPVVTPQMAPPFPAAPPAPPSPVSATAAPPAPAPSADEEPPHRRGGMMGWIVALVAMVILGVLFGIGLLYLSNESAQEPTMLPPTYTLPPPPPTVTPVPTPTATPVPPTNTPVPPTNTPVPPTNTPVPPTDTPVPPTNTPVPPTNTPVPPTNTPVPPTPTFPSPYPYP